MKSRLRDVDSLMSSSCQLPADPGAGTRRWGRAALLLTLCAALSGCALGSFGSLAANVERRDTLTVLSIYSVGLQLRTRADDPGLHFGYSKRSYTFAADDTLTPGWHFLRVPSPAQSAFAQDLMTIGLDLSVVAPEAGFSVGYVHTRLLARVPPDASVLIEYAGPELRIDKFRICAEDTRCANSLLSF